MTLCQVPNYTLLCGDALDILKPLPDQSVHTCVTSPPYFGLRDYGAEGQIGLEGTPQEYVQKLVSLFRQVHRVLRDDGTVWLNLGDSYVTNPGNGRGGEGSGLSRGGGEPHRSGADRFGCGLKPKDLIGIPWRVALALQDDGWYLRQDIIWHKPNPMPESVRDRCTKAHEYLFLLSKSPKYYFDHQAFKEPATGRDPKNTKPTKNGREYEKGDPKHRTAANLHNIGPRKMRNRRSVWSVSTKPFKGAHFATYPPDLIEPCILAGCPEGGTVLDPFNGAGTTGLVALRHGRNYVGIDLQPDYIEMTRKRYVAESLVAEEVFS